MRPATRSDLRWWGSVFGGFLLLALLVYAAAFLMPPAGSRFSGFLLNSGDAWGYRAFVRSFAAGGWLIDNPFSDRVSQPAFFNLLWSLLGKIQRLTGLPFLPIYYGFGVLAAGLLFGTILRFTRVFGGGGAAGRFAFLLAALGGGVGWLAPIVSADAAARLRPTDLFHPEGFPLQSALFVPHFALSIALVGTILAWFHRGVSTERRGWSVVSALLTLALGYFHPYHLATVGLVAGVWVAVEQAFDRSRLHRGWLDLGLLALAMLPAALYYRWFFRQPNWGMWGAQNIVRTGGVPAVLLGLGPLVALAAWGIRRRGAADARGRFLIAWSVAGLGLLFSYPLIQFEGKLVEGLILPLATLGAGAFFDPEEASPPRRKWLAAAGVLLALMPSHAVLVAESLKVVSGTWENFFPVDWIQGCTLSDGEIELNRYLERRSLAGSVIMAPLSAGRILPGVTDARMFVSGSHVTRDHERRWTLSRWFYLDSEAAEERYYVLRQYGVDLVWYRAGQGLAFEPESEPYLEPLFVSAEASLWRVRP
jgi:hypothetical protein